jgi:tRNA pseudouridine38-40 synthase
LVRLKGVIAYDGTGYGGFQIQANAPTIQAELERVLAQLTGTAVRVMAAGRTDAGVHAEGQVIAFDTDWQHPLTELRRGMNALLPEQIAVFELDEAAPGFHPRYDALARSYRYTIYYAATRHPWHTRFSLHVGSSLDIEAMELAARCLIGSHDFLAFGSPPQGENSVRVVSRAQWSLRDPWLTFEIEANAFLYRMVRMLVGTSLRVGQGGLSPGAFEEIVETRNREKAGPAAVAQGLCLKSVRYAEG